MLVIMLLNADSNQFDFELEHQCEFESSSE